MGVNKPFPVWGIGFCALPALGLTFLDYMDQNVSILIVNRKDHKLRKGSVYHLDLFICGAFIYPICCFLGLPFMHASTVPCLIHLISLSTRETVHLEGGGTTTKVCVCERAKVSVRERDRGKEKERTYIYICIHVYTHVHTHALYFAHPLLLSHHALALSRSLSPRIRTHKKQRWSR